jgi:hypothetical protein
MRLLVLCVLASACAGGGGAAAHYSLQLHNATDRKIEEVYIYAPNASDHGASRGALAPDATISVEVGRGGIEVMAISELIHIDDHTRDRPSASQIVEITEPSAVVFYDQGKPPPMVDRPNVFGVVFRIRRPTPEPKE